MDAGVLHISTGMTLLQGADESVSGSSHLRAEKSPKPNAELWWLLMWTRLVHQTPIHRWHVTSVSQLLCVQNNWRSSNASCRDDSVSWQYTSLCLLTFSGVTLFLPLKHTYTHTHRWAWCLGLHLLMAALMQDWPNTVVGGLLFIPLSLLWSDYNLQVRWEGGGVSVLDTAWNDWSQWVYSQTSRAISM